MDVWPGDKDGEGSNSGGSGGRMVLGAHGTLLIPQRDRSGTS